MEKLGLDWIVSNNFKRRSVEQLKGTKTLLQNPNLLNLISCYLKSHAYIFFDSINLTASILCLARFCSKISRIYFLWFYQFDCKYFMLSLFYSVRMQSSPLLHLPYEWYQALWNPFLEILEIFISVNWLSIINPSLFISNLIHSLHFISHLSFIFIEMLLQTSIEKKSLMEQVKRVCDTI